MPATQGLTSQESRLSTVSALSVQPLRRFAPVAALPAEACLPLPQRSLFLFGVIAFALLFALLPEAALASTGTAGGLPYEGFLTNLRNSMTGPVGYTISLIGIIASGVGLIFGGDLNGFFRAIILLVLVVALVIGANSMMSSFFGGAELSAVWPLEPLPTHSASALFARTV
ncbi:TrbC/VirB2 family protein [Ventosimonas gracilis]|uniref:TrbC/VirB2 family protein n=1 Tax=Ventosimonas gracilis TaxID=1680762 RepID=UPI0009A1A559|nr:TrbC/VirB2 family protein [Ventosimonas gracilis]